MNEIGRPPCIKIAPRPFPEASINSLVKSSVDNIEIVVIASLKAWKALVVVSSLRLKAFFFNS